jgi:nicotinamide-nucleotide amidase
MSGEGVQVDEPMHSVDSLVELASALVAAGTGRGITVATAESCTGGLIGHLITEVPGSSDTYLGGAITYNDALKRSVLGVPEETLGAHGAVSAQVAVAMAQGARRAFGADVAIAVTGIAGPTGGSAAKPVGLTYVAVADADGHDVRRFVWPEDRAGNKRLSAEAALRIALERIEATSRAPAG